MAKSSILVVLESIFIDSIRKLQGEVVECSKTSRKSAHEDATQVRLSKLIVTGFWEGSDRVCGECDRVRRGCHRFWGEL